VTFRFVAQHLNHCATVVPQTLYETMLFLRSIQSVTSIVKPTRCTNVLNLFYFGMTLYVFRAVFLSIIRSPRLYIQQQAYVKQILHQFQTDTAPMYQIYFILEWHSTCFVRSFRPSSGVQDCTYSNRYMSNRYCCLLASKLPSETCSVWDVPSPLCLNYMVRWNQSKTQL